MIRPGIVALCYTALLVALAHDWIAAQTDSKDDEVAALLDNDFLVTPLVSFEFAPGETVSHDTSVVLAECGAVSVADTCSPAEPPHSLLMSMHC
jgi:hypothetical protein